MKEDSVSSTAFSVAQGILLTAQRKRTSTLVSAAEKKFYYSILNATSAGRKKWRQLQNPLFRMAAPIIERLMIPGLTVHYVLRKKAIEEYTRKAMAAGATQIINLGAGFDSLTYRLATENPALNLIEIDHPATHQVKRESFTTMGNIPDNLHQLAIDFNSDSLEEKLRGFNHFDSTLKTVYIIEGVLMYLSSEKIVALLDSLKKCSPAGFELVFTFIIPDGEGKHSHGPLLSIYLKIKNEPLNWKINAEQLNTFLNQNQLSLASVISSTEVLRNEQTAPGNLVVHDGELVASANYTNGDEVK